MPFDLPAERVQPLLDSRASGWPADARVAWNSLTAGGDSPMVGLRDLEYFLWYQLPAKFDDDAERHGAIAAALGDLLDHLGYADAASLCRGPLTTHVLAEWDADRSRGYRALRKALEGSGVEPPDTDALSWSTYLGPTEAAVSDLASNALERALAGGVFTPEARGWKRAQADVLRGFLTTPVHALNGLTPQAAVWEERQQRWAEGRGRPARQALIREAGGPTPAMPEPPGGIAERMRPLLRLLEIAAGSPALTQAGYLSPRTVRELASELGWWDLERPVRSGADVPQLLALTELAKRSRLTRAAGSRLVLTEHGRLAASAPRFLWERVIGALSAGEDFTAAVRELLLLRLVQGPGRQDEIRKEILPVLVEAGWRPSAGRQMTEEMVAFVLWDAIRPMGLLGMVDVDHRPNPSLRLTPFGAASARAMLWQHSTAPIRTLR